jgi:integrase
MALTVKAVQKLLRAGVPGKHTDTGGVKGLMLCIESKTSAHWLLRYQRNHKTRFMGLGGARENDGEVVVGHGDVTLAMAREKARRERDRLADGIDPLELKRADREAQKAAEAKRHTFQETALLCHRALEPGWSSSHHSDEFINSLERYTFKLIGNLDIAAIDKHCVLRVLEQKLPSRIKGADGAVFWNAKTITADRVRSRIERVLSFAEARGWRPEGTPNPARWRGFLDLILAKPRAIRPVRPMRAVPYAEVPAVMAALAADQSVAAQALRFIILTGARLSEAIEAPWSEIDFEAREWRIPAERMKGRRPHTVPLSPQAIDLLRSLYTEEGNDSLFISTRTPGHIVESTLTIALRNAGCTATIHGFRSCLKTWAEEQTNFPGLVIELSLAHKVGTAVENAYRRGDVIVKRRKLMEQWARFVTLPPAEKQKSDKVVPLRSAAL